MLSPSPVNAGSSALCPLKWQRVLSTAQASGIPSPCLLGQTAQPGRILCPG